jgi:hypothetical protein
MDVGVKRLAGGLRGDDRHRPMRRPFGVAAAIMLLLVGSAARPDDATTPSDALDTLDAKVELGLHERLIATRTKPGAVLAPFSSDGCSGGLSAGWALATASFPKIAKRHGDRPPWEGCCLAHDRLYHAGSASSRDAGTSLTMRRLADHELRQCVIAFGNTRKHALAAEYGLSPDEVSRLYQIIAGAMYWAVRVGGAPCTGLSWRWGYGWPGCE